ncbi:hypothetical protein C8Q76DRAFT_753602 [Earliella scabrosa]|nr:hypothetical protein C8Q76DRAFT_753602 [Earliella scabrosa]
MHPTRARNIPVQEGQHTAAVGLWGHLLRKDASQLPQSTASTSTTLGKHAPAIAPLDKAGASTRILLHDTQAHLERFTDRVTQLTEGLDDAKRELVGVQKLYQNEHEQLVERIIGLVNRCQFELQKTVGNPAQSSEVSVLSRDLALLGTRLDVLDKKIDVLSALNQTQSQALQTIQDQQGQILSALLPVLPLLQSVPLHIENARNHVKDSISELRRHFPSGELPAASLLLRTRSSTKRVHTGTPDSVAVIEQKRRRVDDIPTGLPSRPCSVTYEQSRLAPTPPAFTHSRQTQSPEVPLSTIRSGSARVNALRSPLADLQLSDQHPVSPSMVFKKPVRVASSCALPITPQLGASGSSPALLGAPAHPPLSSAHTPSRASGARLHIRASAALHASTPPVPAGGRSLPVAASTHTTPQQSRRGSSRPHPSRAHHSQLARTPLVPIPLPVTPVQDRLFRTGTLRSSPVFSSHVQSDMRPPSVPPSSTGKPMSLRDRRALLPDHPAVSS